MPHNKDKYEDKDLWYRWYLKSRGWEELTLFTSRGKWYKRGALGNYTTEEAVSKQRKWDDPRMASFLNGS